MTFTRASQRLVAAAAVALLVWLSTFTVSETDLVIVTLFGRPTRTISDAGLHAKWPFESVLRFDRRLMVYDPGSSEFLTKDKKNLVLGSAVCWRITDPSRFLQTVGDATGAEMRLHDLVWATLAANIGRVDLSDLLSIEPGRARVEALGDQVRTSATVETERRFGVAVVDLQLKRVNFPDGNKYAVYARMRAERERIAREYRAQGEEMAIKIRAEADRQRTQLLAEAYRDAEKLKGEGDAEAARIYGQAYGKNPAFYKFLRTLESYKKILNDKTSIVLSGDSELLKLLTQGKVPDAAR
ncbi:MAG TPA: protease modulator HflC [Vicinamibacterales bacterium]|jgi:membrane protease subunit HflC|nr:protease modulator HflC [Vicinamibacterales bacterium]